MQASSGRRIEFVQYTTTVQSSRTQRLFNDYFDTIAMLCAADGINDDFIKRKEIPQWRKRGDGEVILTVAKIDDIAVGWYIYLKSNPGELKYLCVDKQQRRDNIGQSLLKNWEQKAIDAGATKLYADALFTSATGTRTLEFYIKNDYCPQGFGTDNGEPYYSVITVYKYIERDADGTVSRLRRRYLNDIRQRVQSLAAVTKDGRKIVYRVTIVGKPSEEFLGAARYLCNGYRIYDIERYEDQPIALQVEKI